MATRRMRREPFSLFAFQDIITSVTGVILLLTLLLTLELIQHERITDTPGVAAESALDPLKTTIRDLEQRIEEIKQQLRAQSGDLTELATLPAADVAAQQRTLQQDVEQLRQEVKRIEEQYRERKIRHDTLAEERSEARSLEDLAAVQRQIKTLWEQLNLFKTTRRVIYNPNPNTHKQGWLVDISPGVLRVAAVGRKAAPVIFDVRSEPRRIQDFLNWVTTRHNRADYFILLVRPHAVDSYENVYAKLDKLGFDIGFDLLGSDDQAIDPATGAVF